MVFSTVSGPLTAGPEPNRLRYAGSFSVLLTPSPRASSQRSKLCLSAVIAAARPIVLSAPPCQFECYYVGITHTFNAFVRNHPHNDMHDVANFSDFHRRIALLDALFYPLRQICAHVRRSYEIGAKFGFPFAQKIFNVPERPEQTPDTPLGAVVANSTRHMIVSAHAGNKDNILAVRKIGAREVLEIPYCRVNGIVDGVIVDINYLLRWWWWPSRLWLSTIILGVIKPELETR
jgi:hypothetical protein